MLRASFCVLIVSIVISLTVLNLSEGQLLPSFSRSCGGTNCSSNPCQDNEPIGRSCCWCERVDYAPLQVCQCCPIGFQCCPYTPSPVAATTPMCCPNDSTCTRNGCIKSTVVRARPSQTVCSQCERMYLNLTADNVLNALYVDGVPYTDLPNYNEWSKIDSVPIPADSRLIAVKCTDLGVIAGFLASVDNYLVTDTKWKCTVKAPANWFLPGFIDELWPPAVISDTNTAPSSYHGPRAGISPNAKWIWTQNFGASADTPVFCRGYFPKDQCNSSYGNCSDLCAAQNMTCCKCEMMRTGPSKVCSCCPQGSHCCNALSTGTAPRPPTCCPNGSTCSADGLTCTSNPMSVRPNSTEIDCGPCN
jgi:hypothetical protein